MLDAVLRPRVAGPLDAIAVRLAGAGVSPNAITGFGFSLGVGACVAAGFGLWWLALGLWIGNRVADGLDGPVARRRGATDFGGYLDIVADFAIYGGFVLGVAIAVPEARVACAALLVSYYISGAAFLAWSSIAERSARQRPDERSLHFVGGIAEGTETIVAYVAFCVFHQQAVLVAWVFAAMVVVTAGQRVNFARCSLSHDDPTDGGSLDPRETARGAREAR
jgi:phosphatidylglycerophosphate synthase